MTVENFNSRTSILSALLWNYSKEQRSVLRDRNQKQLLEFKMFSMSYYLLKSRATDPSLFQKTLLHCIEILDMDTNDATYGEPMNAYSSFHMGEEYFSEKLNYYVQDINSFLQGNNFYPKFCYNSIIKSPLENTDSYFFDSFNHTAYTPEFVKQLKFVVKLMDYCLTEEVAYLNCIKVAKDQINLDMLDPNRNKMIAEAVIKQFGL